ncbi:MAG: esterase family protein [Chitinophagaceae bacterium]|nr:MAG: esterase family protein [Chitinophagaceae bacterium]
MKSITVLIALISFSSFALAQGSLVDTAQIWSKANSKTIKAVVIKPVTYSQSAQRFPVVYLLHGYGGGYANWITRVPELKNYATIYNLIIVCPDAENSWYVNSPAKKQSNFESYVAEELVSYIDANYRTIAEKGRRAIAGLSMGGHGAIMLAIRHKEVFGAAGSMSGALDLEPIMAKYDFSQLTGDTSITHFNWREYGVVEIADSNTIRGLRLIVDCGVKDPFIKDNRKLHAKLLAQHVPHDYIERPGGHNWAYWQNAIAYQLMFFGLFFKE